LLKVWAGSLGLVRECCGFTRCPAKAQPDLKHGCDAASDRLRRRCRIGGVGRHHPGLDMQELARHRTRMGREPEGTIASRISRMLA